MAEPIELRLPNFPDCWDTCGNCSEGYLTVVEVLVKPDQRVEIDETVIVTESDKTILDIPAERSGRIVSTHVEVGDQLHEGALVLRMQPDT